MADLDDDFDLIGSDEIPTIVYGENLNPGFGVDLDKEIKLTVHQMRELKEMIDLEINPSLAQSKEKKAGSASLLDIPLEEQFTVSAQDNIRITLDNVKLKAIQVRVEEINEGDVLVKVGPCDLSGVGGHRVREQIIKDLVNQALAKTLNSDHSVQKYTFETVNVSACVGVRGRLQMFLGFFANNREQRGAHMNAYVKTAGEEHLTHWEPRQGPQRFFNDTICAIVTSTTTSIFEKGIREHSIHSSAQATTDILKHPRLVEIFDAILNSIKDRTVQLVTKIKDFVAGHSDEQRPADDFNVS